ncbi:hypothetical protein CEP54_015906 [Fusarium duplospermum]|uniref:Uncharacterized protein n=1 Tax=Fusarium duplospermum TaxID=1325734 RepID=A0A428NK44_9HYPO|nr:hypothetical protein CEP54_015906 [Fusarium duplospermum]
MSFGTPTYFPSPNSDIPANSDIVVLGRLIEHPHDPQSKIYRSSVVPIPPSAIYEGEKTDWQTNLEQIRSVLKDPGLQQYCGNNNWKKPVYLITGIKIARGASVSTENSTGRWYQAELKVDATSVGVPVDVGPSGSWDSRNKRSISYGASTDYIFAYQITMVMPNKGGGGSTNQPYLKDAVYARRKEGDEEEV